MVSEVDTIWGLLRHIADPEIPTISIVDLGIVRSVAIEPRDGVDTVRVVLTPTYSGCPATELITQMVTDALAQRYGNATVEISLSPAWTSDWITKFGRECLAQSAIAPPAATAAVANRHPTMSVLATLSADPATGEDSRPEKCPRCGSGEAHLISQFGSTACKALWMCDTCHEPFDYFKPH